MPPDRSNRTPRVRWESQIGDDDLRGITGRVFGDGGCVGDCDGDLRISISELVLGVSIALEHNNLAHCEVLDESDDGTVGINELIQAVDNALRACVR